MQVLQHPDQTTSVPPAPLLGMGTLLLRRRETEAQEGLGCPSSSVPMHSCAEGHEKERRGKYRQVKSPVSLLLNASMGKAQGGHVGYCPLSPMSCESLDTFFLVLCTRAVDDQFPKTELVCPKACCPKMASWKLPLQPCHTIFEQTHSLLPKHGTNMQK